MSAKMESTKYFESATNNSISIKCCSQYFFFLCSYQHFSNDRVEKKKYPQNRSACLLKWIVCNCLIQTEISWQNEVQKCPRTIILKEKKNTSQPFESIYRSTCWIQCPTAKFLLNNSNKKWILPKIDTSLLNTPLWGGHKLIKHLRKKRHFKSEKYFSSVSKVWNSSLK